MKPAISIITVVRNNKEFIEDAINSVLSQSYPHIEHIIIDGGSTDGTLDIIKKYDKKISKWISELDYGTFDALNKGIKMSSGDVIGFLHSDDLFADGKVIEKIADKFTSPDINILYSDLVYVSKRNINKIIRRWKAGRFSKEALKFGWMPPHPTMFVRKSLYNKTGLFDTDLKIASDYDMILRLLKSNPGTIVYIEEVFIRMRLGGKSNKRLNDIFRKSKEDYIILKRNEFVLPVFTLLCKNFRKLIQFF